MKEKLLCALHVIKRFLWGTYCGMRLWGYLILVQVVVSLFIAIDPRLIADVSILSIPFLIIHNCFAVFMPRTSIVKSGAIAYAAYMLLVAFYMLLVAIYYYYYTPSMWSVIYTPVLPFLLTIIERFFADKLQGWWRRIVKWLYNGIAILPLLAVAALFMWPWYTNYHRKHRFADNDAIERITGVAFPELEIIDYKKGETSVMGDFNDELTLEMEEELSESTYHYLDSIISVGNTKWGKYDDEYSYSIIWGNGLPAPKGECDEDDIMFSLSFKKGNKIIELSYGYW